MMFSEATGLQYASKIAYLLNEYPEVISTLIIACFLFTLAAVVLLLIKIINTLGNLAKFAKFFRWLFIGGGVATILTVLRMYNIIKG